MKLHLPRALRAALALALLPGAVSVSAAAAPAAFTSVRQVINASSGNGAEFMFSGDVPDRVNVTNYTSWQDYLGKESWDMSIISTGLSSNRADMPIGYLNSSAVLILDRDHQNWLDFSASKGFAIILYGGTLYMFNTATLSESDEGHFSNSIGAYRGQNGNGILATGTGGSNTTLKLDLHYDYDTKTLTVSPDGKSYVETATGNRTAIGKQSYAITMPTGTEAFKVVEDAAYSTTVLLYLNDAKDAWTISGEASLQKLQIGGYQDVTGEAPADRTLSDKDKIYFVGNTGMLTSTETSTLDNKLALTVNSDEPMQPLSYGFAAAEETTLTIANGAAVNGQALRVAGAGTVELKMIGVTGGVEMSSVDMSGGTAMLRVLGSNCSFSSDTLLAGASNSLAVSDGNTLSYDFKGTSALRSLFGGSVFLSTAADAGTSALTLDRLSTGEGKLSLQFLSKTTLQVREVSVGKHAELTLGQGSQMQVREDMKASVADVVGGTLTVGGTLSCSSMHLQKESSVVARALLQTGSIINGNAISLDEGCSMTVLGDAATVAVYNNLGGVFRVGGTLTTEKLGSQGITLEKQEDTVLTATNLESAGGSIRCTSLSDAVVLLDRAEQGFSAEQTKQVSIRMVDSTPDNYSSFDPRLTWTSTSTGALRATNAQGITAAQVEELKVTWDKALVLQATSVRALSLGTDVSWEAFGVQGASVYAGSTQVLVNAAGEYLLYRDDAFLTSGLKATSMVLKDTLLAGTGAQTAADIRTLTISGSGSCLRNLALSERTVVQVQGSHRLEHVLLTAGYSYGGSAAITRAGTAGDAYFRVSSDPGLSSVELVADVVVADVDAAAHQVALQSITINGTTLDFERKEGFVAGDASTYKNYTVLEAEPGASLVYGDDTYVQFNITPYTRAELSYDDTSGQLVIAGYEDQAGIEQELRSSGNRIMALEAMRSSGADTEGVMKSLSDYVGDIYHAGAPERCAVLSAMSGASLASLTDAQRRGVSDAQKNIRNRMVQMGGSGAEGLLHDGWESAGLQAWAQADGAYHSLSQTQDLAGYDYSVYGTTIGANVDLTPHWVVGGAFSAEFGSLDGKGDDHLDADINSYYLNFFARYQKGHWTHLGIFTIGFDDIDTNRKVLGYSADGSTSGNSFSGYYELGYLIPLNEEGTQLIQPIVSLSLTAASLSSFTESGSIGNAGLKYDSQDLLYGNIGVGARYQAVIGSSADGRNSVLELRAQINEHFGDSTDEAGLAFVSGGQKMRVKGTDSGSFGVQVGAGLSVPVGVSTTLFTDADAEFVSDYTDVRVNLGLRYDF